MNYNPLYTNYTNSGTTTAADNYIDWMQTNTTAGYSLSNQWTQTYYTTPVPPAPLDPEQVRRNEKMCRLREPLDRWREQNQKLLSERRKLEEAEASERARRLLMEYLDEKNRQNFEKEQPIEILSELHPGIMYAIPYYDGRIKALRGDKVVSEMCLAVKAGEWIPYEDKVLTKLLYLRNDETAALRAANHFNMQENLLEGIN